MVTKNNKQVFVSIIAVSVLIAMFFLTKSTFFPNLPQKLVREFKHSYPEKSVPNNNIVEVNLVAAPGEVQIADNLKFNVWSYNGQIPGPEIRAKLGDTIKINFTNNLPQETTIHFHGIRVPNEMDGVPGVTQEAIAPGKSFIYEFTPKDAGTYWYHPHVRSTEQVERGLYGTIIVEDSNEPLYDQDLVMILDDWRLDETGQIDPRFVTGGDLSHDGRWGNFITVNGSTTYTREVKPGERLRLRLVNTSNGRVYKMDFGDIEATGFAVDGKLARESFTAQGFELAPGNRIDVDITVPMVSRPQPYIIRDTFGRQAITLFKLIPNGENIAEQKQFDFPKAKTFPDWKEALTAPLDTEYVLDARRGGKYGIEWTINGKAHDHDPLILKHGEFNKIRYTNKSARLHPMHLHGQFFRVISRNGQAVDEPYWRDTVLIHPRETVDIGMVPLDKGKWMGHCHVLEHAEAGMMTMIEVR